MTDIHASLSSIYESGKYSDFTIRCGDRESIDKETSLEEDDPHTVERMLAYLYNSDYCDGDDSGPAAGVASPESLASPERPTDALEDEERSDSTSQSILEEPDNISATTDVPSLLNNVLVYAIAEKYGIAELKELAKSKFQGQAGSLLSAREFPEIIRELYRSTPSSDRGLRDIVSQVCAQHGRTIVDSPDLSDIILEVGEFGLDLLREVLKYENGRVEEAVARNSALEGELEEKKDETIELQRKLRSVGKVLKNSAKGLEMGRGSENMFMF
ncbi:hypothetical protein LHYA1_G003352 [Lachnellula hyalina]|uniref:BTB domain-containing protein n=1 Tax=Lachnellula hyalina TaxID=1316788 RepID=A0A8H8R4C4_9HELO|nr:uncharacterized protein LHYA1_G003352 [Lachnellula hyalina]TVY28203.1 hypothetical protein LHYA1_G003352 [Lachnellula hyalina]